MRNMLALPSKRELVNYQLRNDLYAFTRQAFAICKPGETFVDAWYVETLCELLTYIVYHKEGPTEDNKFVINLPPRGLKSFLCSIVLPVFILGRDPSTGISVITYGEDLSRPLADMRRKILSSPWYKGLFPGVRLVRDTIFEVHTDRGGSIVATSVGGSLTGRGGTVFIIDDPIKASDVYSKASRDSTNAWFQSTLLSRPDDKLHAKMILVMQRLHVDDPSGFVLRNGGRSWHKFALPAIATRGEAYPLMYGRTYIREMGEVLRPDAEPLHVLEDLRQAMTEPVFSAQYQQKPIPLEGGILKIKHLQSYQAPPQPQASDTIVQSWDTAFSEKQTADYSVGITVLIRDDRFYILDLVRGRFGFPDLVGKVKATNARYRSAHILIEHSASGISLIQQLKAENLNPIASRSEDDKVVRAHRMTPVLEADRIFLPTKAPWRDAFIAELAAFPSNGSHDDQVDAFVQAINWWEARKLRRSTTLFGYY